MKLLLLTQYYPPEIGAPQNRLHELAVRLKAKGIEVEVLCALPNYPEMEVFKRYQNRQLRTEVIDGIKVNRSWIYVSKKRGIISRLMNYFSFVVSSYLRGRKLDNFDYLLVESPPLFLGWSAMRLSKKLGAKLIFNVSDLWPESAEKLKIVTNFLISIFACSNVKLGVFTTSNLTDFSLISDMIFKKQLFRFRPGIESMGPLNSRNRFLPFARRYKMASFIPGYSLVPIESIFVPGMWGPMRTVGMVNFLSLLIVVGEKVIGPKINPSTKPEPAFSICS